MSFGGAHLQLCVAGIRAFGSDDGSSTDENQAAAFEQAVPIRFPAVFARNPPERRATTAIVDTARLHEIPPHIRAAITDELAQIKREHEVTILWAIKSGSRAWGFPSPDSDNDARFIYVHRLE